MYGPIGKGEVYPVDALTGTGFREGKAVRYTSPEWMVKFHSGYELK